MSLPLIATAFLLGAAVLTAADDAEMRSEYSAKSYPLSADPESPFWKDAPKVVFTTDRYGKPVPGSRTEVRSRWTGRDLCFLFVSEYQTQWLKKQPSKVKETWGLWEYDVVELFIGWNFDKPRQYKEFEVSPQGEWVDLDCDKDHKDLEVDWRWDSNFRSVNKVDEQRKIWISEWAVPWKAIDERKPAAGNRLRLNLYRIEGGPENRKYMAWRPVNAPSFHTPEAFGQMILVKSGK
jgi:hypothetical protein